MTSKMDNKTNFAGNNFDSVKTKKPNRVNIKPKEPKHNDLYDKFSDDSWSDHIVNEATLSEDQLNTYLCYAVVHTLKSNVIVLVQAE